ncbi:MULTISPECIES: pyridoxamine 5'-phosphate oxidase [Streptomyces]|uniref:Pyridoxine/pyridoxamine 5'-phosphate oxidase n=1 Tax=Streptomyces lienomycini TaxID=284035 RepID=A0ABV9WYY2_9ACTN|nr:MULTISPECIES: pyridoxamine 5'-phosphate oxidase [Streptomyces]
MGGVTDREADSAVPAVSAASSASAAPAAAPLDLASMRRQYRAEGLSETELAATPVEQFARWFKQAATDGGLFEPNAVVVSTADPEGRPSSRTVLLKHFDEQGFVFYTNYDSRKARELDANPYVSLLFPWHPMARQVVVSGVARRTGRDETAAYFRTRPHGSQLGAWASAQSRVVADRRALDAAYAELDARYPQDEQVPVPPHWGGFRVVPEAVEFWQGRENRLHDRLRYVAQAGGAWRVERLGP